LVSRRPPRGRVLAVAAARALALGATLAGVLAAPGAAQEPGPRALPRHPEITGVVTCEARVNYGVAAWVGVRDDPATSNSEREESRTTAQVAISFSIDGGRTFVELPLDPKHRLDKSDGFAFIGSFPLSAPLPRTVILRARAASPWADGTGLGEAKLFGPILVPHCAGAIPAPALPAFAGASVATPSRPTAEFDPDVVVAAAVALLALLAIGLWARRRVSRP
jgi:hypothetical protein